MARKPKKRRKKPSYQLPDPIWRDVIRQVGKCEICNVPGIRGKTQGWINLQAHHIIPRGHHDYRHDPSNGICVCPKCHKWGRDFSIHNNPDIFDDWLKVNRPGIWDWYNEHNPLVEREILGQTRMKRRAKKNDWGVGMTYAMKEELLLEMYLKGQDNECDLGKGN